MRGELAATQKLLTEADTVVHHQRSERKDLEQRLHDVKQEHSAAQADLQALQHQHVQLQRDSKAAMARCGVQHVNLIGTRQAQYCAAEGECKLLSTFGHCELSSS